MTAPPRPVPGWPKTLATAVGVYAILGGSITLIGWFANLQRLTDWRNDGISMFPNPAGCVVAAGLALLLINHSTRRRAAMIRGIGGVVLAVGALTLFEHLTGIDVGIDRLLIERPWGQGAATAPMRMGIPGSTSLVMIGTALGLLTIGPRARRASAALAVAVIAIATLSLIGYAYGAQQMYTLPRLTGIAMQTASMILALGIGLVASLPEEEPLRTVLAPGAAGALARHVLPVIIVLPLALGWLRVLIQEHGLVDTAFGTALRTLIEVVLLTALLWRAIAMVRAHERALRESEGEVRLQTRQIGAFLETAAIGIHRVGADGTILWANDAELELLGYLPDEYIGRHITAFHADPEVIADILARLHRGETVREAAARMRCKDGSIKSVLIDSSVLWDEGRFVHTQCFTRDVTDRRQAEEVQALLAAIIETSGDAIISKTLEGVITSWNAGAERVFGYTAAEMIGKGIDLLIPADRHDEEREILARLRRGERIEHYETVRRTKHDRLINVSLTISPLRDRAGRIIGASKIARDITDRKQAEAEREEGNRRKDEFIAILAHELRNPLAPVRTAASHLMKKVGADSELGRPVAIIERQVAQMSRLIDDLLDASRISRGALELRRDHVTCSEIVDAAVDACRDEIQVKGHHLRVGLPPAPVELEADRERLVQVLCNLLGNAAKYTAPGGEIDLTVTPAGSTLEISVKDNGVGIPPGRLTDIFDLFARVDHALDRQDGLGIGLTLVRQLVELHGGTVEARSRGLGHGSEFLVKLPAVAPTAPATTDVAPPPPGVPLRILVADDNHDAVESLVLLLRLAGHEVHAAFDGEAAIRSAETFLPEVALIDIGMPNANGYDVARRIRAHAWGEGMYLVALTGWGQDADKRRAQDAGFDAHFVKPVPAEVLDRLLATIGASVPTPVR